MDLALCVVLSAMNRNYPPWRCLSQPWLALLTHPYKWLTINNYPLLVFVLVLTIISRYQSQVASATTFIQRHYILISSYRKPLSHPWSSSPTIIACTLPTLTISNHAEPSLSGSQSQNHKPVSLTNINKTLIGFVHPLFQSLSASFYPVRVGA